MSAAVPDLSEALNRIEALLHSASETRLKEMKKWSQDAEQWKTEGDMFGWNFNKGMEAGANYVDIYYRRIGREVVAIRELINQPLRERVRAVREQHKQQK